MSAEYAAKFQVVPCAKCGHHIGDHNLSTNYWCRCGDCPEFLTVEQMTRMTEGTPTVAIGGEGN